MSITPNDNEKFEAIVAGFEVTDTAAVKQLERKNKASEMTFTPLPSLKALGFLLDNFFMAGFYICALVSFVSALLRNEEGSFMFGGISLLCLVASWMVPGGQERELKRQSKGK